MTKLPLLILLLVLSGCDEVKKSHDYRGIEQVCEKIAGDEGKIYRCEFIDFTCFIFAAHYKGGISCSPNAK